MELDDKMKIKRTLFMKLLATMVVAIASVGFIGFFAQVAHAATPRYEVTVTADTTVVKTSDWSEQQVSVSDTYYSDTLPLTISYKPDGWVEKEQLFQKAFKQAIGETIYAWREAGASFGDDPNPGHHPLVFTSPSSFTTPGEPETVAYGNNPVYYAANSYGSATVRITAYYSVTVRDTWVHTVTVNPSENGSITADRSKAAPEDIVSVTAVSPNEGYELDTLTFTPEGGSATDILASQQFSMPNQNVVIDATFKAIPYNVTVTVEPEGAGNAQASAKTATIGEPVSLNATPSMGLKFKEWQVDVDGVAIENDSFTMPASDVSIKAIFEPISYSVAFDANGGSGKVANEAFLYDQEQPLTTNTFTRKNFTFAGWKDASGKSYTDGQKVKNLATEDGSTVTLFAQWKAVEPTPVVAPYVITFSANGGKGTMAKQEVPAGQTVKLSANAFTRSGYTFNGWNTQADGKGTSYKDKADIKPSANMILYAQWTKTSSSTSGAQSKTATATKASTLPKTGDPAATSSMLAMAVAGAAALGIGASRKRR